jgi:hypothetical protein
MMQPATQRSLAAFFVSRTCQQLGALAVEHDIPLLCMENNLQPNRT